MGLRGKLFRTKMLTEESIDIKNTCEARQKETIRGGEGGSHCTSVWAYGHRAMLLFVCVLVSVNHMMGNMRVPRQCPD